MQEIAIVLADASGIIRYWSSGAEKAFGHPAHVATGQTLDIIVPPELREHHWSGFRRAMASGKAAAEGMPGPFPVMAADGGTVEMTGCLRLLRGQDGRAQGAMVIFG